MPLRLFLFALTVFSIFLLHQTPQVVEWDQSVVAYLADHRSPPWTAFMLTITYIGTTWGFLVFLFFPFIIYLFRKKVGLAFFYLVSVGLLKWSVSFLKWLVGRERPELALIPMKTLSMPSGHATNAVLMYGVLAIFFWGKIQNPVGRVLSFIFCIGMIFLTDLSRVYLGVHYPSDVLMGSLYAACGLWVLQGFKKDLFSF